MYETVDLRRVLLALKLEALSTDKAVPLIHSWVAENDPDYLHIFFALTVHSTHSEIESALDKYVSMKHPGFTARTEEGEALVRAICIEQLERATCGEIAPANIQRLAEIAKILFEDHSQDDFVFPFPSWFNEMYALADIGWPNSGFSDEQLNEIREFILDLREMVRPANPLSLVRKS